MLTEDEAKTKWCPFARAVAFDHPGSLCIGAACMAWRFHPQDHEVFWTLDGVRTQPSHPYTHEECGRMKRETRPLPLTGYCGLAGRPE